MVRSCSFYKNQILFTEQASKKTLAKNLKKGFCNFKKIVPRNFKRNSKNYKNGKLCFCQKLEILKEESKKMSFKTLTPRLTFQN